MTETEPIDVDELSDDDDSVVAPICPASSSHNGLKRYRFWEVDRLLIKKEEELLRKKLKRENRLSPSPSLPRNSVSTTSSSNNSGQTISVGDEGRSSPLKLSDAQASILEQVVKHKRSVFITGGAGTGKTFLLREIIKKLPAHSTFVTATTGIAALQLGGSTVHSFAGCGIVRPDEQKRSVLRRIARMKKRSMKWKTCQVLVIDEISMLAGPFFDILEYVARAIRHRPSEPFGGIQLVLSGDFLQLPPVGRGYPNNTAPFVFESRAWLRCNPKVCVLDEPFRQRDEEFFRLLKEMRVGYVSSLSRALLHSASSSSVLFVKNEAAASCSLVKCEGTGKKLNLTENEESDPNKGLVLTDRNGRILSTEFDGYIFLRPRRVDVDRENSRFYEALSTKEYYYTGFHEGEEGRFPESDLPLHLRLRVGCRVMLTKNLDVLGGLVNGSVGVVTDFYSFQKSSSAFHIGDLCKRDAQRLCTGSSEGGAQNPHFFLPVVEFEMSGKTKNKVLIQPAEWTQMQGDEVVCRDVQLPLIIAYAITMHKSQGMSLTQVDIDFAHIFEVGQAYVALSRCTSLNSVRLHGFSPDVVVASDAALGYYQALLFVAETTRYWASLEAEGESLNSTPVRTREGRGTGTSVPIAPPCGYYCPLSIAVEDDGEDGEVLCPAEGEEEWDSAFYNARNAIRGAPSRTVDERNGGGELNNESVEVDRLRLRIGTLLALQQRLKSFLRKSIQPITQVRNCRIVMDVGSVFDLYRDGSVAHKACCLRKNLLRLPLVVYEFFLTAEALKSNINAIPSSQDMDGSASRELSFPTSTGCDYAPLRSECAAASDICGLLKEARRLWELDIQRVEEVAPLQRELGGAWREYRPLLPLFLDNMDDEEVALYKQFADFTLNRDPRETAHHRPILEYAVYLAGAHPDMEVVLCTGSDTLAASASALGLGVATCVR